MTIPRARARGMRWLIWIIWIALTVTLLVVLPSLPWQQAVAELRRAHVLWLSVAVLGNLLILPLWAVEWRLLVPQAVRVSYSRMFEIVAVTSAVLNSVPFLAGETSGVLLLIGRAGLSRGAALSVLAMDQLLVGFAKIVVVVVAAIYAPLPDWLRAGILGLLLGVTAMIVVLVPLAHHWRRLQEQLVQGGGASRARNLGARVIAWGEYFEALRQPRLALRLGAIALGKKVLEVAAIVAVQLAFGMEPQLGTAFLVLAALAITTLIPLAPANLGVYEATVFATYRFLGLPAETALGIAILQHLCFLLPSLVTGYVTISLQPILARQCSIAR